MAGNLPDTIENNVLDALVGTAAFAAPTEEVIAAQSSVLSAASGFGWPASMPFGTQYGHHPLPNEEHLDAAWSRLVDRGHRVAVQDEFLLKYRIHGASASISRARTS